MQRTKIILGIVWPLLITFFWMERSWRVKSCSWFWCPELICVSNEGFALKECSCGLIHKPFQEDAKFQNISMNEYLCSNHKPGNERHWLAVKYKRVDESACKLIFSNSAPGSNQHITMRPETGLRIKDPVFGSESRSDSQTQTTLVYMYPVPSAHRSVEDWCRHDACNTLWASNEKRCHAPEEKAGREYIFWNKCSILPLLRTL